MMRECLERGGIKIRVIIMVKISVAIVTLGSWALWAYLSPKPIELTQDGALIQKSSAKAPRVVIERGTPNSYVAEHEYLFKGRPLVEASYTGTDGSHITKTEFTLDRHEPSSDDFAEKSANRLSYRPRIPLEPAPHRMVLKV